MGGNQHSLCTGKMIVIYDSSDSYLDVQMSRSLCHVGLIFGTRKSSSL